MKAEDLIIYVKKLSANAQPMAAKTVSVDTLMLALRLKEADLMPLIEELEGRGELVFHPRVGNVTPGKTTLLGSISIGHGTLQ